jgi:hypothetical protein
MYIIKQAAAEISIFLLVGLNASFQFIQNYRFCRYKNLLVMLVLLFQLYVYPHALRYGNLHDLFCGRRST